jgi:hypothetical protein
VFILEHYFASKSFTAVREAFSNVFADKEVPSKTRTHRLVTKVSGHRKCLRQESEALAFGHRDLQTLPCHTSFCADFSKKEFIRITHEAWRNWNTILNRLLPTLTWKDFAKSHETQ